MSQKSLTKVLEELEEIAGEPCSCTEDQQSGIDPSLCRSCNASHILNEIDEEARYELRKLEKDAKKES